MSKTHRPRHRNRYLSRLRQNDRFNYIESERRHRQLAEEAKERSAIERLWEQSIDFFASKENQAS